MRDKPWVLTSLWFSWGMFLMWLFSWEEGERQRQAVAVWGANWIFTLVVIWCVAWESHILPLFFMGNVLGCSLFVVWGGIQPSVAVTYSILCVASLVFWYLTRSSHSRVKAAVKEEEEESLIGREKYEGVHKKQVRQALRPHVPEFTKIAAQISGLAAHEAILKIRPSMLSIFTEDGDGMSAGSGVFIQEDASGYGYAITCAHVVHRQIIIKCFNFMQTKSLPMKVMGIDLFHDLAIVRFHVHEFEEPMVPATLGDSDSVETGDVVYTYGNPRGLMDSVGMGVISHTHEAHFGYGQAQGEVLQTDATINPGNSGGALINEEGYLIGLNAYITTADDVPGCIGLGFSITSRTMDELIPRLMKGDIPRAYLGVQTINDTISYKGLAALEGIDDNFVMVASVDEPAQGAGVCVGDVIVAVDGRPLRQSICEYVAVHKRPYEILTMSVQRDRKKHTYRITLGVQTQI